MKRIVPILVLTLTGLCVPARAQGPSEQTRAEAREAFAAGEEAFDAHDYTAALERFRRAFELQPHDAVRFNIAVCFERLGRFREAAAQYRQAARSEQLGEAERQRAREQAERVSALLGELRLDGEPAGAVVRVDDQRRCELPCKVELDPGEHRIVLRAADGRETGRTVSIERGGTQRIRMTLGPPEDGDGARFGEMVVADAGPPGGRPGPLTWVGGAVAVAGVAGVVGFGLRARTLHDDYDDTPTAEVRDDGIRMRRLTNASIGVAAAGAIAVLVDLLWLGGGDEASEVALSADGVRLRF